MVYKNIDNTASFASAAGDYAGTDNAVVELEVDEYTFEKTATPTVWSGDDPLTYTITLTNVSGGDLTDITVTDVIPTEVQFIPGTVVIDDDTTTNNFDVSGLPTIVFGSVTPLTVTDVKPLVITFQVEKAP